MSEAASPGSSEAWPVLDVHERRVLGVLVEKAKTTPDAYPMSLNALVTGCNQKSNRDPILELDEGDVEDALVRCKNRGLVAKVIGGRVERWRHLLYESWNLDKIEIAIVAELLLRGPQTEGELRGRASRMEPIEDLEALRQYLKPLVDRHLVLYLTPEERRGALLTHGFHDPAELSRLRARAASAPPPAPASPAPASPTPASPTPASPAPAAVPAAARTTSVPAGPDPALGELREELQKARTRISGLEQAVAELRDQLRATHRDLESLRQALGG